MTMTSNKGRLQIVVVALMMALCVSFVHAAEFNITDCINITQPGTYTLQNDIDITGVSMSYAGAALNVNACINIQNVSSIVVDCQGYRIHGNVTDGSGGSIITLASDTEGANITVKNCVIDVENNQSSPNGDLYVLAFVPIASTNFGTIVVENNTISVLTSASGAYSEAMIMWDSSAVGQTVTVRNNHLSAKGHYALGVDLQTSSVNDVYGNDVYVETVDVVSPAIYIASGGIGSAWNNTINTASDYCGISNALLFAFNNSLMGNAYLRPNGTGFSQTCTNNGSGVCTQSYNVSGLGSAVDYLPIALTFSCVTNWTCSVYDVCTLGGQSACLNVTDQNLCGENFTGNFTMYDNLSCGSATVLNGSTLAENWRNIVASENGSNIYATADSNGHLYKSSDFGATWVALTGAGVWSHVATSASGSDVAVQHDGGAGATILVSHDGGVSWSSNTSLQNSNGLAMSANGTYVLVPEYGGYLHLSSDGGATFSSVGEGANWQYARMSDSGQYMYSTTTSGNGRIAYSHDYGATWTMVPIFGGNSVIMGLTVSSDGQTVVASTQIWPGFGFAPYLWTSIDAGLNYTNATQPTSGMWGPIAMSGTGQSIAVADGSSWGGALGASQFTVSTDSGATFSQQGPTNTWVDLTVARGVPVFAAVSSGQPIYVNTTMLRVPVLNVSLVSPVDLVQTIASRAVFVVQADTDFDFADSVCIDVAGDMRCQYNVTLPANVSFNVTNLTPGVSVWNATISLFNYTNTTSSRSIEYVLTNQSYSYALQLLNGTFSQSLPFCEGAECTTSVLRRNATVGQVVNVVLVPNASGYYPVNSTFAAGTERARHVLDDKTDGSNNPRSPNQFLSPLQFTYVGLNPLVSEDMFGTKQSLLDSQSYAGWQSGGADGQNPYFGAYREDLMPFMVDGLTFVNNNADDTYHVDDYLVQGSDDNNTWTDLANVTGRGNSSVRGEAVAFENNHAYVYYRVQVLKWGNGTTYANGFAVGELYLHRDRAYVDDGFVAEFDSSIEGFTYGDTGVGLPQVTQDQVYARNGSLKVVGGDWRRNISTPRGKRLVAYVYDANYTSGPVLVGSNGYQAVGFGRTGLGDGCGFNCPGRFTGIMMVDWMPNYYGIAYAKYLYTSQLIQTSIPRSVGWHKFETEILENGTLTFKIDDVVAYTIYSNYQISPMRGREEYGRDIQSDTVSLSNWYVSNPLYVDRMKLEVIHPYRTQEVVQVSVISGDSVGAYVNLTTFSDVAGPAGGDGCFEGFIYTPNKDTHLTEVKFDTNYPSTYGQGPEYYYVYNDPDGYARQTQVGGNNWSWTINNGHVGMAPVGDVADVQDARLSNGSYRPSMLFMANSTYVIGKYNILGCGLHFIAPKVNVSSPIGLFEQISAFYSTAHGHPANVLYVTGVAVENDTYVWNGTSTRFGAAVIDNVVLAANRSLLVDGLTEGARASDHDILTVAAGVKNVSGVVSFYVGDVLMNVGASSVGVVTKMSPVDVLSPSGNITTKYQQVQWTPATEGATAPVYNVIYNNGTVNISVASGLTSENVSYNFSGVNVPAGQMYVVATDGYVTLTSLSLFSLNLSTSVTQTWCEAGVVPNELDQPSVVLMHFNATTHSELDGLPEFASVENGISNATCTYVNGTNDTRRWSCAMPMHYWYTAGNYTANFQFDSVNASTSACQYAQLLAFQRPTPYVTFPSSAPGVNDAPGNVPVTVRNTGNAPFDTFVTAQDLNGRAVPALKLLASKFKMGQNLSVAVPMVHNVAVNVSSPLAPAQGAETNVSIWLSMPANQTMQEYYTVTPWVLTVQ